MKNIESLYPSLVGSHIEHSFMRKKSDTAERDALERSVISSRAKIKKDIDSAFKTGGELCIILLAELLSYYTKQVYYMGVRSSIELRRYRPTVLEYLREKSVEKRAETLVSILSTVVGDRDIKVLALKYFLSTYTSRISEFRGLLSKEEFLMVS